MRPKLSSVLIHGRNLSLVLLCAGFAAWADPSPTAWPFKTSDGDLVVAVPTYACAGGRTVTLIPTLHFADTKFYDRVERAASAADHLIYEGVRPVGFFGPPFEDDPRSSAPTDPREITTLRLRSVAASVEVFRRANGRDPESLAEVFAPNVAPGAADDFARRTLVDYWGTPLVAWTRADGRLVIASRGADRRPGRDNFGVTLPPASAATSPDEVGALAPEIRAYRERALALGLALESDRPRPSLTRETSRNADVSLDLLDDANVAALRNRLPLDQLAKTPPGHVALVYGAAHAAALARGLGALPFACRAAGIETWTVIGAAGLHPERRVRLINEVLTAFSSH